MKLKFISSISALTFLFFFYSCNSQVKYKNEGIVIIKNLVYDTLNHKYYSDESIFPNREIWVKDNFAIEEVKALSPSFDKDGIQNKLNVLLYYYIFIDMSKNIGYAYQHFSDTAKIWATWDLSIPKNAHYAWDFWSSTKLDIVKPIVNLSDTTINDTIYKRLKLVNGLDSMGDEKTISIAYAVCNKQNNVIKFEKVLSDEIGCDIVMLEKIPTKKAPFGIKNVIQYVSNKLNKQELRIFAEWEKNEEENMLKK